MNASRGSSSLAGGQRALSSASLNREGRGTNGNVPLTTAQVDRLGERLQAGPLTDQDRELLLEFRSSFLPAYEEVVARIRHSFGFDPTGRPEKTPESIIAKLRRSETKLSRCRTLLAAGSSSLTAGSETNL